jgi:hypothetical protein
MNIFEREYEDCVKKKKAPTPLPKDEGRMGKRVV